MPVYHFHTEDGRRFEDEEGTTLADLQAARRAALRFLGELLQANEQEFWQEESLRVIVTDDGGATLFTLELTARHAAAAPLSFKHEDING